MRTALNPHQPSNMRFYSVKDGEVCIRVWFPHVLSILTHVVLPGTCGESEADRLYY
jgi:hypothetical protein